MKKLSWKLKTINKLIIVFIASILFAISGLFFARTGFHNYEKKTVNYAENNQIHYQVYLKPNDFFESEYLEENKTYITSLIDKIHIDYDYQINFTEDVTGSYSYYLKAIVTANQTNSDSNYFTREYTLSEPKEQSFQNIRQLNINDSIDVSYDTYNELLIDFKEEFGVSMDGNLEVVLVVRNMVNHELEERTILKESNLGLNIPLTTLTMEVPIESDSQNSTGELVSYEITKEGWFYPVARVLSILSYIASFLSIIYLIILCYQSYRMESKYHKELKRILKVYDGVIVNLKNMPNVEVEKLLPVLSFEELIDAHSEVRNPINYIQKRDGAIFLLMSNGYYYYYKLKRELFTLPKEVEHEKVD